MESGRESAIRGEERERGREGEEGGCGVRG